MQMTTRRSLVAAGTLAAGTLAAVTLLRKPGPTVLSPARAESVDLRPITTLRPTDPPAALPDAIFHDADGATHRVADFKGQGLILNLWATWCVPCVAEMPALQSLAEQLKDSNILVLPLSSDRGGAATVAKFYQAHGISSLPIWLDAKGEAASAWGVSGLPTTIVVNRNAQDVARLEGAIDWSAPAAADIIRRLVG